MKAIKQLSSASLKHRLYRSLCRHGIAVLSSDLIDPEELDLCLGYHVPITGIWLLQLLTELAREGKVVIWRDDNFVGFLVTKVWQREMRQLTSASLRAKCESLILDAHNGAQGIAFRMVVTKLLKPKAKRLN